MHFKKYISLLFKDIIICKNILFLMLYYSIILCFFSKDVFLSNTLCIILTAILMNIFCLVITYSFSGEKNKGTELLTTTSYTRHNMVLSKYSLCFCITASQIILTFIIVLSVIGYNEFMSLDMLFILSTIFLFTSLASSIFIPISFKFSAMTTSIISGIWMSLLEIVAIIVSKDILKNLNIAFQKLSIIFIVLSIVLIQISIFVSQKIYSKKDL